MVQCLSRRVPKKIIWRKTCVAVCFVKNWSPRAVFSSFIHKNVGKSPSFFWTFICRKAFLMSDTTPTLNSRNLSNKVGKTAIRFNPFSRHWFKDGPFFSCADASKTGLSFVVELYFNTALCGRKWSCLCTSPHLSIILSSNDSFNTSTYHSNSPSFLTYLKLSSPVISCQCW